jgi:predicted cupin superfamily sugar epimerase
MHDATADELIERYDLEPHPEGGYYRETWRADQTIDASAIPHPGDRQAGTSMLYLLPAGTVSRLHSVRSEELWLHHAGDTVELTVKPEVDAEGTTHCIGRGGSEVLQARIPAGWYQTAAPVDGEVGWTLVACLVTPAFEFEDLEILEE